MFFETNRKFKRLLFIESFGGRYTWEKVKKKMNY